MQRRTVRITIGLWLGVTLAGAWEDAVCIVRAEALEQVGGQRPLRGNEKKLTIEDIKRLAK